ncbi:unnamed protein product [Zymoseptoria tritici ST99CH_1A5]|uniref:GDP-mannose transporter n=1 Tax=Zymoseptoria tritici ST99CH_1A5 TaxID=1276529 RepID=A0A1Y6LNA4_ZYMTR|nr:unnamed protein product [Zymoseptoria tritici ST99CH_1A5]
MARSDRGSHEEKRNSDEEKRAFLLPIAEHEEPSQPPAATLAGFSPKFWISALINTVSTVAIVFTNKRIFSNPSLRHSQVTFAAFHFSVTALFLYIISRPKIGMFTAKRVPVLSVLPLATAMIPNVVLPNASLAYSSVQFYQVVRVLLTPCVLLITYLSYQTKISRPAALTLIPVCVGVAIVSYFDAAPTGKADEKETSLLGVFFAFSGVIASSAYTVLIKHNHQKLDCTSHQLLLNLAAVAPIPMLYIIPFTDDITVHGSTSWSSWVLIIMSAVFACMINLSQFIIIEEGGAVTSTVVGHFKTLVIVSIGWMVSHAASYGSLGGAILALGSIGAYQRVQIREARK